MDPRGSTRPSWTDPASGHRHGVACYWDHRVARWVCTTPGPRPPGTLELVAVSAATWEACARLRVHPHQRAFVLDVAWYLCDCAYGDVWHPVAAVVDGTVVGFAMWGVEDDGSGWIGGVVVDAGHQGRGLGRRMVQELLRRVAATPGVTSLALTYAPDNAAARALYASLGFVETGERDGEELVARRSPAQG